MMIVYSSTKSTSELFYNYFDQKATIIGNDLSGTNHTLNQLLPKHMVLPLF